MGSLVASEAVGQASVVATHASFEAIASSAELGARFAIASVRFAGDVAVVSFTASAAIVAGTAAAGSAALAFSVEMSRAAFEGSLAGAEHVLTAVVDGTEVEVLATPLTAGTAERVIGFSFALAEDPGAVVCVVLNDVGRQLYAADLG